MTIMLVVMLVFAAACGSGDMDDDTIDNTEDYGQENEVIGIVPLPELIDTPQLMDAGAVPVWNNMEAQHTVLSDGTFNVGVDIPVGRYIISATEGSGAVMVARGVSVLYNTAWSERVTNIVVHLVEGDVLIGITDEHTFEPYDERQLSNVLTTGSWIVGLDILPGVYTVRPTYNDDWGRITIFAMDDSPENVYELWLFGSETTDAYDIMRPHIDGDIFEYASITLNIGDFVIVNELSSTTFE